MQQNVILIWDTPGYVISFERACILIYFHSSAAWKSQYFHFLDTQLCRGKKITNNALSSILTQPYFYEHFMTWGKIFAMPH